MRFGGADSRPCYILQVWNWGRLVNAHDKAFYDQTFKLDNKVQFMVKVIASNITQGNKNKLFLVSLTTCTKFQVYIISCIKVETPFQISYVSFLKI